MSNKSFTLLPNGDEALFYSGSESENRCIGHMRIDLGGGDEFWSSWQPHAADDCNDEIFKRELDGLAGQLRKNLFKSRAHMYKYIAEHPALLLEDGSLRYYGYSVRTDRYEYYIRCTPERGNYSYIYCYLRKEETRVWKYMNMEIDPESLPTKDELIARLKKDGGTDNALARLREEQHEEYGNGLDWLYPISEGYAAGGFILPIREGILWIPYNEIEKEEGEILLLDDAELLNSETCEIMADDFQRYADGLFSVLREAAVICEAARKEKNA